MTLYLEISIYTTDGKRDVDTFCGVLHKESVLDELTHDNRKMIIFRSSLQDDLIKWVGCASICLLTILFLSPFNLLLYYMDRSGQVWGHTPEQRVRVHLATVLLRPPSGHRPGRFQARLAGIFLIGLYLKQP